MRVILGLCTHTKNAFAKPCLCWLSGTSEDFCLSSEGAEVLEFLRKVWRLCAITALFGTGIFIPLPLPLFGVTRTSTSKFFSPRASKHPWPSLPHIQSLSLARFEG